MGAESRFEDGIDTGVGRIHDHDAVLEHQLDGLVVLRDHDAEGLLVGGAEAPYELVHIVVIELVDAAAGDAQLVAEVGGDGLGDLLDGETRRLCALNLLERALDFGE